MTVARGRDFLKAVIKNAVYVPIAEGDPTYDAMTDVLVDIFVDADRTIRPVGAA